MRYTIVDTTKMIHRDVPMEECNTDAAEGKRKVDVGELNALLTSGYTYCLHCFDFLRPESSGVLHPFVYKAPTVEHIHAIAIVRTECAALYQTLLELIPQCAERTLAIRHLEECSMWANKAIVFDGENYIAR